MDGEFGLAGRMVLAVLRASYWVLATVWLGLQTVRRIVWFVRKLPELRSETLICPRGHESPAYGVFECSSAAPAHLHEGWVFARCRVCGQSAGWTPCQTCGLPILNPLMRDPS